MFCESFYGAALAGRVATLEQQHDPLPALLDPALHFQQLDLQRALGAFVFGATHPLVVGIPLAPRLYRSAVGAEQSALVNRVVGIDIRQSGAVNGREARHEWF